jgi:hypothetical protein
MVNQNARKNTKKSIIERFATTAQNSPYKKLYSAIHFAIGLFAIFVSIKCNNGFSAGSFFAACCCPELYLIYIAATNGLHFCMKSKKVDINYYN